MNILWVPIPGLLGPYAKMGIVQHRVRVGLANTVLNNTELGVEPHSKKLTHKSLFKPQLRVDQSVILILAYGWKELNFFPGNINFKY
jgi:hypothetical protein